MELDATDFCTDELKNKILPLKNRLRELEKERESAKVLLLYDFYLINDLQY